MKTNIDVIILLNEKIVRKNYLNKRIKTIIKEIKEEYGDNAKGIIVDEKRYIKLNKI
ncbi:MAG: hypothetical protein QXM96_01630 [Candidatus Woesearchaeota archaeon]